MANPNIKPRWKKGESGNPAGRLKGAKNYKTLFREAYVAIAKDLKLGKEPDVLLVEILKRGIKEALKGNYSFYKDIMDRIFGKPKERIETEEERILIFNEDNLFRFTTNFVKVGIIYSLVSIIAIPIVPQII